ncbi:TrkH family potassium uptake protein [Natronincola ferrireducens]|uniref:Trk system potassium uptake protein TrkH n=1 Tax=Natronincola ferrireducens TaxID=393762 RepID=A0A1G9EFU4_9FIRM|nr:TrkH family potassium uptake protein [Natronincola ferrireducens]SDK75037.1 trk system potassium uptake protein TrkH [Natronincola ferrireducens]
MKSKIGSIHLDPTQILVMGFASVIMIGAILLNTPIASEVGERVGFINALFTATSAVCVTGLAVVDTGTYWSTFGKTVILILIQIGGLGFMTMATMVFVLLGKKISLRERLIIQEALNQYSLAGIVRFTKYIIMGTFIIEGIGALFLSFRFVPEYGWIQGIAYSIFHAISAFCNAGFDLIGEGRGLTPYVTDPIVNFSIGSLVIIGGIGFSVLVDLTNQKSLKRLSLHTKMVLFVTVLLLALGFGLFLLLEWNNPETLGNLNFGGKLLAGFFQSMTTRTAGFNTIVLDEMTNASKMLTIILMYIGGSPASTAGGIKTATLGVILFSVVSVIRGKEDTEVFNRRISRDIVNRSITVAVIGLTLITVITMILMITEAGFTFEEILFETTSAFGTVGLSLGITSQLSNMGRLVIIFMMFAGRVGPLTIAYALARQQRKNRGIIKYPEGKILVG